MLAQPLYKSAKKAMPGFNTQSELFGTRVLDLIPNSILLNTQKPKSGTAKQEPGHLLNF